MSTDAPRTGQPLETGGEISPGAARPPVAEPSAAPAPEMSPAAPAPGGIYPAGTTVLGEPLVPIAMAHEPKKRAGLIAVVAAGVVLIGGLLLKIGLPLLVGTAASGLLGGMLGGPFEKLPQDRQDALEQRMETALGDSIRGLDDTQASAKIATLLGSGLPRMSDQDLTDKVHLTVAILTTTDVSTCARIARSNADGTADPEAVSTAVGALDAASIERWFDINITAVESESAGAPPVRTVDPDEAARVITDAAGMFTESQAQHVDALYNGGEVSDADACDAVRAVYGSIERLPPADLALAALYDVSP